MSSLCKLGCERYVIVGLVGMILRVSMCEVSLGQSDASIVEMGVVGSYVVVSVAMNRLCCLVLFSASCLLVNCGVGVSMIRLGYCLSVKCCLSLVHCCVYVDSCELLRSILVISPVYTPLKTEKGVYEFPGM